MGGAGGAKTARRPWGRPVLALGLAAVVVAAFVYFDVQNAFREALAWIDRHGAAGMAAFVALYVLATVLFLPGSVLTLGAGAVFGLVQGAVVVSVASTLGATAAFLVGRYLARDWVARKVSGNDRFQAIDDAVAREGWKIVGLTRLSPVFPFNLLNYAYGLTRVSLRDYLLASWVGMMPGTVMYVYIGSLAGNLASLGTGASPGAARWTIRILGLAATVGVTVYVTRIARAALAKRV